MTLEVLKAKGQSNRQIAQLLGVTEAAVRYHLRRQGCEDGRTHKEHQAAELAEVIDHWVLGSPGGNPEVSATQRPVNVRLLHDWLQSEYAYQGSYKSVLRFVRARYPQPKLRPFRRVETPPGAQAQVDWGEFADLDVGTGPENLYGFVLVLSHSRKEALIWCRCMDQLAWHHAHNEAFRRLEGIPAVLRKNGVSSFFRWLRQPPRSSGKMN